MLSSRNIVLHFVFVGCIGATHVPGPVSRDIAPTDTILQVINEIFSCLTMKVNGNSNNKELLIHLVGFSRYKSDNWKEILRLTRINIKTDNSSPDYMSTVINEVMNRHNKTGAEIDNLNDDDVNKESKNFLRKLKEVYLRKIPYRTLNNKTSQLLPKGPTSHSTYSKNTVAGEVNLAENSTEDIEVWVPSHARRIFRGRQTKISFYPFMASIHIFTQFTCAGSIIAADLVITAASCLQLAYNNRFYRENAHFLAVRVGSSYYGVEGDLIPVLEVYFHPSYDPPTLHNNLAIVRLRRHIRFRNRSRVKKVDIDRNSNALPWNTDGIAIVGWGAKTITNKIKDPLMNKIAISILDFYPLEECQEIYSKTFVTERHFCAGFITQGGGACNRDVGAPGLAGGLLVGVVSFGSASCGAANAPTVFTKLGFYTDWIEEIMAQETHHYINRPTATYRPQPIHTIETTTIPNTLEFAIEPLERQIKYRNLDYAELTKNKNTQEHADVPYATKIQNYILRDETLQFTVLDHLLQIDKLKTGSNVVNQQRKPIHSVGRAGLPRDEEYVEATTETKLDVDQFVQLHANNSDEDDILVNEVNANVDMKYTEPDKVSQKDKVNIGIDRVFPEPQLMGNEDVDLTFNTKYTKSELTSDPEKSVSLNPKGNNFVVDKTSLSKAKNVFTKYNSVAGKSSEPVQFDAYVVMAMQLPHIVLPMSQSSAGKSKEITPFEKVADSPTMNEEELVIEQHGVTFSDPELNQQINDLIDYINVIDKNSLEQESFSNVENIIGVNKLPEDQKIQEIVDDKLEPTKDKRLNLENLNEIDDDKLEPTEDNTLKLENLNEMNLT